MAAAQFHAKKPDKHIFTVVATLVAVPTLTFSSPHKLLSSLHYLVSQLLRLATPRPSAQLSARFCASVARSFYLNPCQTSK